METPQNQTQGQKPPLRFSLILATTGRAPELSRFLDSLSVQTCRDFELIIIDQNPGKQVDEVLSSYQGKFPIVKLPGKLGLSKARNLGLQYVHGRIVAFPDDDCWYPADLLAQIDEQFRCHPDWQGISCLVTDENGRFSAGGYMARTQSSISRGNIWRSAVSPGLFLARVLTQTVGGFDPSLGVGAETRWGSAEESDYVLRAIARGLHIEYVPAIRVLHPRYEGPFDRRRIARGYNYGLGMGYVLKKHHYSLLKACYFSLIHLLPAGVALVRGQFGRGAFHLATALGRMRGWFQC